jgi:transposase InsO family protein
MTHKNEAFPNAKHFSEIVWAQSKRRIKKLQVDGGRDYGVDKLRKFCHEKGIRLEITAPYTPEENSVAELSNGVVLTKARCMTSGLPTYLWSEAAQASSHILNQSFCKAVGMTPVEALDKALGWKSMKPSIAHFRAYSCLAWKHIL